MPDNALELLFEYWAEGCQCPADSADICPLCQKTFDVLKANGYFSPATK